MNKNKMSDVKCPRCKEQTLEYTEVYSWRSSEPDVITAEVKCQSCGRVFTLKGKK